MTVQLKAEERAKANRKPRRAFCWACWACWATTLRTYKAAESELRSAIDVAIAAESEPEEKP